jgi:hypothetical protein
MYNILILNLAKKEGNNRETSTQAHKYMSIKQTKLNTPLSYILEKKLQRNHLFVDVDQGLAHSNVEIFLLQQRPYESIHMGLHFLLGFYVTLHAALFLYFLEWLPVGNPTFRALKIIMGDFYLIEAAWIDVGWKISSWPFHLDFYLLQAL